MLLAAAQQAATPQGYSIGIALLLAVWAYVGIVLNLNLGSTCAIMRRVAESGGALESDFGGAAQAPVAQKSGSATVPGGAP